jgi:predicted nucleic acid-binding Zn ribbon protein
MKRQNTQSISDILREMIENNQRLSTGLQETQVIQNWPQLLGPSVARHTEQVYLSKGVLFVKLNSSVVRNELLMLKEKIIKSLNQSVNATVVNDIVFR